jgi:methyl-accepting chemotaxis protein
MLGSESIAITKDITDAISSVNTDISKVTSDLADGLAAAATKVSVDALGNVYSTKEDVQQAIATVTQSVTDLQSVVAMQTDLTSLSQTLNAAIGEQSEISDGILDTVNYLNGWKGVIPFDKYES